MMKKYIIIALIFLSSFLFIFKVNALSNTIYIYPTDESILSSLSNIYSIKRDSVGINTFNICKKATNECRFLDLDSWVYNFNNTASLSSIDKIVFYEINGKIQFRVNFKQVKYLKSSGSIASGTVFNFEDYYNSKTKLVLGANSSSSYNNRILTVSADLKTFPFWDGYLISRVFEYNFDTFAITSLGYTGLIPLNYTTGPFQINNNVTVTRILYANDNIYNAYDTLDSVTNEIYYKSDYNPLPNYLTGYKKITLNKDTKYAYLSNLKKGRIYIPKSDFKKYGGKLAYWDLEKDYMSNDAVILDYKATDDWLYVYQDFDLSSYENSDLVVFNKFLYLENMDYDDFEYDIYVPESMYVSLTKPIPNAEGGNDFPAEYKNANGEIVSFTPKSVDSSMSEIEKTLYQISYSLRDNNLLAYFTNAWESLKLSKIYNYIILTITGGIIIFLFKVLHK